MAPAITAELHIVGPGSGAGGAAGGGAAGIDKKTLETMRKSGKVVTDIVKPAMSLFLGKMLTGKLFDYATLASKIGTAVSSGIAASGLVSAIAGAAATAKLAQETAEKLSQQFVTTATNDPFASTATGTVDVTAASPNPDAVSDQIANADILERMFLQRMGGASRIGGQQSGGLFVGGERTPEFNPETGELKTFADIQKEIIENGQKNLEVTKESAGITLDYKDSTDEAAEAVRQAIEDYGGLNFQIGEENFLLTNLVPRKISESEARRKNAAAILKEADAYIQLAKAKKRSAERRETARELRSAVQEVSTRAQEKYGISKDESERFISDFTANLTARQKAEIEEAMGGGE